VTKEPTQDAPHQLLNRLTQEYLQTETSAAWHCRREAKRLGDVALMAALMEIAQHADQILTELPLLARSEGLAHSPAGNLVGALFSQVRDKLADKLLDRERSYRGTILGVRHGIDVVRLLRSTAAAQGRERLVGFCDNWLRARIPLLQRAEDGLLWFAEHPERALERATS
jgi:hypothetical protein